MGEFDEKKRSVADAEEVLSMLTSVMRGRLREPVVVTEQKMGESGHVEKSVKVVKTQPTVKERMAAAEMLARRYGILDGDGGECGVDIFGEEKIADGDVNDDE